TIPVSSKLLQEIDDYILYHRPEKEGVEYIFVSHSKANIGESIGRTTVEDMFNDIEDTCGFKYIRLTPHTMRHTHASELQDLAVDVNIIKERLGHRSIETTAKYAKPSIETQIKAYERYLESKESAVIHE